MAETKFVETEALLAVMNGDREALLKILRGMSERERRDLGAAAAELNRLIRDLDHPLWDWSK